jgi:hypothetical protein
MVSSRTLLVKLREPVTVFSEEAVKVSMFELLVNEKLVIDAADVLNCTIPVLSTSKFPDHVVVFTRFIHLKTGQSLIVMLPLEVRSGKLMYASSELFLNETEEMYDIWAPKFGRADPDIDNEPLNAANLGMSNLSSFELAPIINCEDGSKEITFGANIYCRFGLL